MHRKRADQPDTLPVDRVVVPLRAGTELINTADIDWIEAGRNYVRLHERA
jgi:DNA-binding LytR/AlgR family response regulator